MSDDSGIDFGNVALGIILVSIFLIGFIIFAALFLTAFVIVAVVYIIAILGMPVRFLLVGIGLRWKRQLARGDNDEEMLQGAVATITIGVALVATSFTLNLKWKDSPLYLGERFNHAKAAIASKLRTQSNGI